MGLSLYQRQPLIEPVSKEEVVPMTQRKMVVKVKYAASSVKPCYCLLVEGACPEIPKMCILNQECYHCAFDQWMDTMEGSEAPLLAEAA